jgi:hypothetical protein
MLLQLMVVNGWRRWTVQFTKQFLKNFGINNDDQSKEEQIIVLKIKPLRDLVKIKHLIHFTFLMV